MKKEIITGCFLILLLAVSIVNIHYLNKLTGQVVNLIEGAEKLAQEENWEKAEEKAERAAELWTGSDTYTHLVLRHPEIDAATDSLYGLLEQIYAREPGAVKGAAQAASSRVRSLASIEEIRFGSIFQGVLIRCQCVSGGC